MADPVQVYDPITGLVESADPVEARRRAREEGATIATPEQVERDRQEREYGGAGGVVGATVAGAARGLSFGTSDVLAAELGLADRLRAYKELHPIASGIGEYGSLAATALLSGGASAAGEGLTVGRALSAPLRAVEAAGAAVGRGVGGGFAGRVASEAVLGAAFGGGMELSEQALDKDPGWDGEQLVAAMGWGALAGGGFGAILGSKGAASAGAQRLRNAMLAPGEEAAEKAMARVLPGATEGSGTVLSRAWRRAYELTGGDAEASIIQRAGQANAEGVAIREEIQHAKRTIADGSKEVVEAATQTEAALREVKDLTGKLKPQQWEKKVAAAEARTTLDASAGHAAEIAGELDQMVAAGRGAFGYQPKVKDMLAATREALAKLQSTGKPWEAAHVLDGLKRDLQGLGKATAGGGTVAQQQTHNAVVAMQERVRQHLMNPAMWGEEAAAMQRGVNEGLSELLEHARQNPSLNSVLAPMKGAFGRFEGMQVAPGRALEVLQNPLSPARAETLTAWRDRLANGRKTVDGVLEHMELTPAQREALESYRTNADKALGAMDRVERAARLEHEVSQVGRSATGSVAGAIAGAALGGAGVPLGAIAPLAAIGGAIVNPERAIRMWAAGEELGRKVGLRMRRGPAAMARTAKATARAAGDSLAARAPVWSAHETAARARAERQHAAAARLDPEKVRANATRQLALVAPAMPEAVREAADVAARGAAYLARHAPRPRIVPGVLLGQQLPPSDHEIEIWERRRQVVERPDRIVGMVGAGELAPEAVDAMKAVYPRQYEELRTAYLAEITDMAGKGLEVPREQVASLEMLLGVALEPIDAPDAAVAIQAQYAAAAERPKPRQQGSPSESIARRFAREEQLEVGQE